MPSTQQSERLYFAGIKKPATDTPKESNLAGDIIHFIQDNPLVALGGSALATGGLYLYGGYRNKKIPVMTNPAKRYTDAIQYSMMGLATLIAGTGIMKRVSQESPETFALKCELKKLQNAQRKSMFSNHIFKTSKPPQEKPKVIHNKLSDEVYDKDMPTLFQN
jgi:hypothetical protein